MADLSSLSSINWLWLVQRVNHTCKVTETAHPLRLPLSSIRESQHAPVRNNKSFQRERVFILKTNQLVRLVLMKMQLPVTISSRRLVSPRLAWEDAATAHKLPACPFPRRTAVPWEIHNSIVFCQFWWRRDRRPLDGWSRTFIKKKETVSQLVPALIWNLYNHWSTGESESHLFIAFIVVRRTYRHGRMIKITHFWKRRNWHGVIYKKQQSILQKKNSNSPLADTPTFIPHFKKHIPFICTHYSTLPKAPAGSKGNSHPIFLQKRHDVNASRNKSPPLFSIIRLVVQGVFDTSTNGLNNGRVWLFNPEHSPPGSWGGFSHHIWHFLNLNKLCMSKVILVPVRGIIK